MNNIELKAGDTLSNLANNYLPDYSYWKEIAYNNNINIFEDLTVGSVINIPNKEELQDSLDTINKSIDNFGTELDKRVNDLKNDRNYQSITKILGPQSDLLASLDLSSISDKLKSTVNTVNEWQLIQWVM